MFSYFQNKPINIYFIPITNTMPKHKCMKYTKSNPLTQKHTYFSFPTFSVKTCIKFAYFDR